MREKKRVSCGSRDERRLRRKARRDSTFAVGVVLCIALARLFMGWGELASAETHPAALEYSGVNEDAQRTVEVHTVEARPAQTSQNKDSGHFRMAPLMQLWEGETQVELRLQYAEEADKDARIRLYPTDNPSRVLYESGLFSPGESLQYVELAHTLPVGRNAVTAEMYGGSLNEKTEITIDVLPAELGQKG